MEKIIIFTVLIIICAIGIGMLIRLDVNKVIVTCLLIFVGGTVITGIIMLLGGLWLVSAPIADYIKRLIG
jgi:hypothetical protein